MHPDTWERCCVCATHYKPDATSNGKKVLYRCTHCSDFDQLPLKDRPKEHHLHICPTCHTKSTLYHASSHCWAKVFVSNEKGSYEGKKAAEWTTRVYNSLQDIVTANQSHEFPGLNTIHDVSHYLPCSSCQKSIYGTRWISCTTQRSFCGDCYTSSPEFQTEDVWFMRQSIYQGLPATGPLIERPKTFVESAANKAAALPKGADSGPGPSSKPIVRITIPGENYSDDAPSSNPDAPYENAEAPSHAPAASYVDETAESYSEEMAVNLKRTNAYYDDDDDSPQPATVHIFPSNRPPVASSGLGYSNLGYIDVSVGPVPPTGGYSDDSSPSAPAGGYTDDDGGDGANVSISIGYSDDGPTGQSMTKHTYESSGLSQGYTDDSRGSYSDGYIDDSSAHKNAPRAAVAISTGYDDDSGHGQPQTGGYENDEPPATSTASRGVPSAGYTDPQAKKDPFGKLAKQTGSVPAAYSDSAVSAGYSDETTSGAAAAGYSDDGPNTGGYSDDGPNTGGYTDDGANTGGDSDEGPSTGGYTDDGANTGGYSDEGANTGGYSDEGPSAGGYSDDTPTPSAKPDPFTKLAKKTSAAAYSGSSNTGYTDDSGAAGGYGDDAPSSSGYNDDSQGGYSDESSGYSNETQKPVAPSNANRSNAQEGYINEGAQSIGYAQGQSDVGYSMGYAEHSGYDAVPSAGPTIEGYSDPVAPLPITTGPQFSADGDRDWNTEFQTLMARFRHVSKDGNASATDILLACRDLYSLSVDFIENAEELGRTIIEEVSIPSPAKTIKPVNVGGVAGGEKYIERGIFFKFAIDAFGVYGGDEYAQKAAGHELGGLKAYYNCQIDGLNTPFMLLMDYRGYRLIATTKLPIGGGSLIYGSADGGVTIHKENKIMNAMMEAAAKMINIKPHVVGMRNQTDVLFAPTDIEGHLGADGRYYVLDTARICPPEPVHKSFTAVVLPPEPISTFKVSSFKMWSGHGQRLKVEKESSFWKPLPPLKEVGLTNERWNEQIHAHLGAANAGNQNLVSSEEFGEGLMYYLKPDIALGQFTDELSQMRTLNVRASGLVKKLIYGAAILVLRGRKGAQLFNLLRYETIKNSPVPLSSDAFTPFGKHSRDIHNEEVETCFYKILSDTIPGFLSKKQLFPHAAGALQAIQQAGINTRMIGFLRSGITDTHSNAVQLRAWILNEMVVRVTKNYLRSRLRQATSQMEAIEPIIIDRFNLLLGTSQESTSFWATEIKAQIVNKFGRNGQALTPAELETDTDLRDSLNKLALFQLLQAKIGVIFTENANARFQVDPTKFDVASPLSEKDLGSLVVGKKSLLQPDLDKLILKTAGKESQGDANRLLELSGMYLPGADSHPAIALQRLHIAEKLLMELTHEIGHRFHQNAMYSASASPLRDSSLKESDATYLRQAIVEATVSRADAYTVSRNNERLTYLQRSTKHTEILSHLEVLRLWIDSTPYCPLEISCKLFYLRGCLAIVHRLWHAAEGFLRAAYDSITKVTSTPGASPPETYQNGYVTVDNDRPFSLLILDKLVYVMSALGREGEAIAYAEKFVAQLSNAVFPGRLKDLKRVFGHLPPYSFAVYHQHKPRHAVKEILGRLEDSLLSTTPVNEAELSAWCARVNLTNFDEVSGFSLGVGVLQQYLDSGVYLESPAYPKPMRENAYWSSATRNLTKGLDVTIMAPPVLLGGGNVFDLPLVYNINPNRLQYSRGPHRMILLKDVKYDDILFVGRTKFKVDEAKVAQSHTFPDLAQTPRGTVVFKGISLTEGTYLPLILDAQGDIIGGAVEYWAAQLISVVAPTATSNLILCHDRFSGYWGQLKDLPGTSTLVHFAMDDSEHNKFDAKNTATAIIAINEAGKCWKSTRHNYLGQPPALLREKSDDGPTAAELTAQTSWTAMTQLIAWTVKSVAISWTHALILTDDGEVLSVGSNAHGALGHGDTVAQTDPRTIRRIKGKSIASVYAGADRSIALDEFGTVYQWGKSFTALPEVHPFFSGKSKASKGSKIPISKAVFQAFRPLDQNDRAAYRNEFFNNDPVAYLSTDGAAYLWCASTKLFPSSEEYTPERVLAPKDPIVDIAVGAAAIACLTVKGEVWTAGTNLHGELGVGFTGASHVMARNAFKYEIPYGCAEKVVGLDSHFITRVDASMTSFYALSENGEFFAWGGSNSWAPEIPNALKGMKVKRYSNGLRGLIVMVDQTLTIPMPHHPLAVVHAESKAMASFGGAGMEATPQKEEDTGFTVEYLELDPAPNFSLVVSIPKAELGQHYHIRVVKPGETKVESSILWRELSLDMSERFQATIDGSYSESQWGPPPHYISRLPPIKPGPFQVLIVWREGDDESKEIIKHRSPTFVLRAYATQHTLTASPLVVKPQSKITFKVSPVPSSDMGQWIVIRQKPGGMMYGCVQVNASELTWDAFSPGEYTASWENTNNMTEPPMEVYAQLDFEVGEPVASRPTLDISIVPSGPYFMSQLVTVNWKYTANPPAPGTQFFGAIYLASDQNLTAVMTGGYTSLVEESGCAAITLPAQMAQWEFRAWSVTSSGMVRIASVPIDLSLRTESEIQKPTPPVEVATEEDPTAYDEPDVAEPVPSTSEPPRDVPTAVGHANSQGHSFKAWSSFFDACGIGPSTSQAYASLFEKNRVPLSKLYLIDGGVLASMTITNVSHLLLILEKIDDIKQARLANLNSK